MTLTKKVSTDVDFEKARRRRPHGFDTEGGKISLAPSFFLASNTHLATRNPKFRTEIAPKCGVDFFWSSPEFGGKIANFRTAMEPICDEDLFFCLHLNLEAKFRNSALI